MCESVAQDLHAGAGHDAEHHGVIRQLTLELVQDSSEGLWLHTQHEDVSSARDRIVIGRGTDAVGCGQGLTTPGPSVAGNDLLRIEQTLLQNSGDHHLGHHAASDKTQCPGHHSLQLRPGLYRTLGEASARVCRRCVRARSPPAAETGTCPRSKNARNVA